MKIRNGFVSNSSSSSFSVLGAVLTEDQILKAFKVKTKEERTVKNPGCSHSFDRTKMNFCGICGKPSFITEVVSDESVGIYELVEDSKWSIYSGTEFGDYVVGLDLGTVSKKKIAARLEELKKVSEEFKAFFGEEPDFLSGEYAC